MIAATILADTPPAKPEFRCRSCELMKSDYMIVRGRRVTECRACYNTRRNRNRRALKQDRRCLSCKKQLPSAAFEVVVRRGLEQLGSRCVSCAASRRERLTEQRENEHPYVASRVGAQHTPDFTSVAQAMLYPDRPTLRDYHKLTRAERARVYVVQRELARRYSPFWCVEFDNDPPLTDILYGAWAKTFLETAELPAVLLALTPNEPAPSTMVA